MISERHAYFFPHPLKASDHDPGRHPGRVGFTVGGALLSTAGAQPAKQFRVFADGYGENLLGRNQDPCVFGDPTPVIHAFCKLDAKGGKHYVEGRGKRNLAQVVKPGDVVFYGSIGTRKGDLRHVFIDTVMVVEKVLGWPTERCRGGQKPNRLRVDDPAIGDLSRSICGKADLRSTDAWRFCLRDAENGHGFTAWDKHKIILGQARADTNALGARDTSFVPVVLSDAETPIGFTAVDPIARDFHTLLTQYPRLCGPMKPAVPVDWKLAADMYDWLVDFSGPTPGAKLVAIPPLTPLNPRWRPGSAPSGNE